MKPSLYHVPAAAPLVANLSAHCDLQPVAAAPLSNSEFALWHDGASLQLLAPGTAAPESQRRNGRTRSAARQLAVRCAAVELEELQRRARGDSLLVRACGEVRGKRVLDCMAGWGVDGLLLCMRGAQVRQVERSPLLWSLLIDLQQRCLASGVVRAPLVPALCADAWTLLEPLAPTGKTPNAEVAAAVDVVYLDPMFEQRRKGALPNKRLQWLAQLPQGTPLDLPAWIDAARALARERVVLKRRLKDPTVAQPSWSVRGRTARFDVYSS